ncbi:GNAT family N-acetyltransferase [Aquicoccus sp. SCR17]|nr:GNAT family N-acetyltransferase [Carideicomes alvinocaridis]
MVLDYKDISCQSLPTLATPTDLTEIRHALKQDQCTENDIEARTHKQLSGRHPSAGTQQLSPVAAPNSGLVTECFEKLSAHDLQEWEDFWSGAEHQHPRQHPIFAAQEVAKGRKVIFATGRRNSTLCALAVITLVPHAIIPGIWVRAYCQSGPICDDAETMKEFLDDLLCHPSLERVGSLHITPYWLNDDAKSLSTLLDAGNWREAEGATYRSTGLVDLDQPLETIFEKMSKSARRETRRASRQGIYIKPIDKKEEAELFFSSLNRLRSSRGLPNVSWREFNAAFEKVLRPGNFGTILSAWKGNEFLAGIWVVRSNKTAHGSHFTTETEPLRAAGNLRIAPAIWLEAMRWAKERGCVKLDLEGYAMPRPGEEKYNIYKYKSEFRPSEVIRIAERKKAVSTLARILIPPHYIVEKALNLIRRKMPPY